jgi:SAM-dependent methyltransferase
MKREDSEKMVNRYQFPDHRIRLDYVMDVIRRLSPGKTSFDFTGRVIDFGCGETPIQEMKFLDYLGIDIEPPSNLRWSLKANYEEPLNIDNFGKFDLALWLEGPEHTLRHEVVFENIRKALKPDGFLIITCPEELEVGGFRMEYGDKEHKCGFGLLGLRNLIKFNGFTVLEIAEVFCRIPPEQIGYHWLFCLATPAKYDPRYVKEEKE